MKVVTETYLRSLCRKKALEQFSLAEGQLLTPSARAFLSDRRIPLVTAKQSGKGDDGAMDASGKSCRTQTQPAAKVNEAQIASRYVSAFNGGSFDSKPEHMTHLKGNRLVDKGHDRIVFRGRLDSFQSAILMVQAGALEKGCQKMVGDLDEILEWVRSIMKADVLETPLEKESVLGLSPDELRQHSHNPKKAYGVGHITPSADMGTSLLGLNFLRSLVREVETAGVRAFHREFEVLRPDILTALNRMSSALYIMMVRERAGMYPATPSKG
ncbi:MAG: hypothetical protein MI892_05885 [Desulfobacterales bacterium]|nr:hypothetical protein [Desulfobacterales bacterium]